MKILRIALLALLAISLVAPTMAAAPIGAGELRDDPVPPPPPFPPIPPIDSAA
jgi:hypothetical protein